MDKEYLRQCILKSFIRMLASLALSLLNIPHKNIPKFEETSLSKFSVICGLIFLFFSSYEFDDNEESLAQLLTAFSTTLLLVREI